MRNTATHGALILPQLVITGEILPYNVFFKDAIQCTHVQKSGGSVSPVATDVFTIATSTRETMAEQTREIIRAQTSKFAVAPFKNLLILRNLCGHSVEHVVDDAGAPFGHRSGHESARRFCRGKAEVSTAHLHMSAAAETRLHTPVERTRCNAATACAPLD